MHQQKGIFISEKTGFHEGSLDVCGPHTSRRLISKEDVEKINHPRWPWRKDDLKL